MDPELEQQQKIEALLKNIDEKFNKIVVGQAQKSSSSSKSAIIAGLIVLIALVAVGAVYYFKYYKKEDGPTPTKSEAKAISDSSTVLPAKKTPEPKVLGTNADGKLLVTKTPE